MVVARVYLIILSNINMNVILVVILMLSVNIIRHFDVKKNIAYSTSIHLLVILMLSIMEQYSRVVLYIILHRIIKGQIFQSSGYVIHRVRGQDIRRFVINRYMMIRLLRIIILSAIIRMVIVRAKELVVLNRRSLIIMVVVILSFMYTMLYMNKLNRVNYVRELEGFYVVILIVSSIIVVMVRFNIWVRVMVLVCCVVA